MSNGHIFLTPRNYVGTPATATPPFLRGKITNIPTFSFFPRHFTLRQENKRKVTFIDIFHAYFIQGVYDDLKYIFLFSHSNKKYKKNESI